MGNPLDASPTCHSFTAPDYAEQDHE